MSVLIRMPNHFTGKKAICMNHEISCAIAARITVALVCLEEEDIRSAQSALEDLVELLPEPSEHNFKCAWNDAYKCRKTYGQDNESS